MTRLEKRALRRLIELSAPPRYPARCRHLRRCGPYHTGWIKAHRHLADGIRFILSASNSALKPYALGNHPLPRKRKE